MHLLLDWPRLRAALCAGLLPLLWAAPACAWGQTESSVAALSLNVVLDAYLTRIRAGPRSATALSEGGHNASLITLRGQDPLGGGLSSRFQLEAGLSPLSGAGPGGGLQFNRVASLGLAGPWGQIDMGRQYTPMFLAVFGHDPFRLNAVFSPLHLMGSLDAQAGQQAFAARSNGLLRYRSPSVTGQPWALDLAWASGTGAGSGAGSGLRGAALSWQQTPLSLSYARQQASNLVPSGGHSLHQALSASWRQPGRSLHAHLMHLGNSQPGQASARVLALGLRQGLGPHSSALIEAAWRRVEHSPRAQQALSLGLDHHLAPRTRLYARWMVLNNRADASATLGGVSIPLDSGHDLRLLGLGLRQDF